MVKVSVSIPTYNRAHYLTYAVQSVLSQTYADFELIISDDGSRDRTPELVKNWQQQDSRIRYVRHPQNIGRSRNMRSGFDAATGDYFIKFDDDDALTPHFLEKMVAILDQRPEVDFICSDHWIIDAQSRRDPAATQENSAKWGKDELSGIVPKLAWQTFQRQSLQVGSTLFRRTCLAEVDYMRPQADGCEDFDLLVRLAIAGKTAYFIPELLMEYRFHGAQTSLRQNLHFLKARVFCLESYKFTDPKLTKALARKLASNRLDLGLRLLENGQTPEGRALIEKVISTVGPSWRAQVGLSLSYMPVSLRQFFFEVFRKLRPQDYTEKVRTAAS
ncbi:MAG: glycosyltransferase [Cyanobacteria bacterium P01_H01_bin.15]